MPKILSPKDVSGTTRFLIDFDLTSTMVIQLLKEFRTDFPDLQSTANTLKMINKQEKKAIEISKEYISIFPELNQNETENIRKRIYKHVARRSEVYFGTSNENLNLSISSLLTDDLRSCASLLYYSLHKFINGEMYNYFNSNLELEEHEIDFKEIEHFTSANFSNYVKKIAQISKELSKDNYHDVLCISKANCFDPFVLSEIIIPVEILEQCKWEFQSYIEFLCLNFYELSFDDSEIKKILNEELECFYKKIKEKSTTQEEEVKAAISFALLKIIDNENEIIWMFYVLALRLYWLRQTADYEFDFEVKTSVREMSMLVASLKHFLDIQKEKDSEQSIISEEIHDNEGLENEAFTINRNKEETSETIEFDNSGLLYYNVNAKFPAEIIFNEDIATFLTAVHLDPYFSKNEVIKALNLTENVTNRGKYFIYENKGALTIPLYIFINSEGRWTAWIPNDSYQVNILTPAEMIEVFNNFWNAFVESYNDYFNGEYQFILATSEPIYIKSNFETSWDSIGIIDKAALERKFNFLSFFVRKIAASLKLMTEYGHIQINDLSIYFNLTFRTFDYSELIPYTEMFVNKAISDSKRFAYINIVVTDDNEKFKELYRTTMNIVDDLKSNHNFEDTIERNFVIQLTSEQIDNYMNGSNQEAVLMEITDCLNSLAYDRIMGGECNGADKFIEACLQTPYSGSYPLATMGLWYLRNGDITIDESEEKGIEHYKKAIEMDVSEDLNHLKQKFFYEMARFYLHRKKDYSAAEENIILAKEIGEDGYFYEDVLKLIDEFPKGENLDQPAAAISRDVNISTDEESCGDIED